MIQCALTGPVGYAANATFFWRIYSRSYGSASDPKLVGFSSHQLVMALRTHPQTVKALGNIAPEQRQAILDGAQLLSTRAFLYAIRFYDDPVKAFPRLFDFPYDPRFYKLVLAFYVRNLRSLFQTRGVKPANGSAESSPTMSAK